ETLLEAGANPDIQSDEESYHAGSTALIKVASSYTSYFADNAHTLIERLVAAGADVNLQDRAGNTALMWAIAWPYNNRPNIRVIQALLAAGADLDLQNNDGCTALTYARQQSSQHEAFTPVLEMLQHFLD
ncbi:MAG: ankyrin repeat domain-containing protein, partial [Cyanobacteria bacterium P01_F01_bin.150]